MSELEVSAVGPEGIPPYSGSSPSPVRRLTGQIPVTAGRFLIDPQCVRSTHGGGGRQPSLWSRWGLVQKSHRRGFKSSWTFKGFLHG